MRLKGLFDSEALALVDSGASHNFISAKLVSKLGWKARTDACMQVKLANGDKLASNGTV